MSNFLTGSRRPAWLSFAVCVLIAVVIVIRAVYEPSGSMHNDSMFYLRLAISFLEGTPIYIHGAYETIWPPGYPAGIAGIASITSLPVFWAAKLLHIVLIFFTAWLLHLRFKAQSVYFISLFLLAPVLFNFIDTMSEGMFITGLIAFVLLLERGLKTTSAPLLVLFGMFPFILFMIRYIGALGIGISCLVGLYLYVQNQRSQALWLGLGTGAATAMMGGWFALSSSLTGLASGAERPLNPDGPLTALYEVARAFGDELNLLHVLGNQQPLLFVATFVLQVGLLIYLWKSYRSSGAILPLNLSVFSSLCIVTALVYLLAISLVHIIFGVFSFYFRHTGPGTVLLLMALTHYLLRIDRPDFQKALPRVFATVVVFSFLLHGPLYAIYQTTNGVQQRAQNEESITYFYEQVPPNSMVVFGHRELYYLRPDIAVKTPLFTPQFAIQEPWDVFYARIRNEHPGYPVYYITVQPEFTYRDFHSTVWDTVEELYPGEMKLIELD